MTFEGVTYVGPPITDPALLDEVPEDLAGVLRQTNGLVIGRGAFHLRGAVHEPRWHALRTAWHGPDAFAARYRSVQPADVPFGQDALGDQYLLRHGVVWRLSAESDEVERHADSLAEFLDGVSADVVAYLAMGPLVAFWEQGGALEPGQLLSVYPPLLIRHDGSGYSYRAISALDRLGALAAFAAQVRDVPDGTRIKLRVGNAPG